jgi:hypothetical protein
VLNIIDCATKGRDAMTGKDRQEPTLDDLLNDPIVQILMRRDAVDRWKLEEMIARVRLNRRAAAERLAA